MKRKLSARRPSAAMVVAVVALVSSLTGGAVAATLITGDDIAKNAIAKKHIKKNSVVSKKVKDGSLLNADFKAGQLPAGAIGPQGPSGAAGATGAAGAKGDKGDKGDTGDKGDKGDTGAAGAACLPADPACVGPTGATGAAGRSALTPLQTGETIIGGTYADYDAPNAGADWRTYVNFPIPAPSTPTVLIDGDEGETTCTGTAAAPTAPGGTVCIYVVNNDALDANRTAFPLPNAASTRGFAVSWNANGTGDTLFYSVWAYTAP